jgi:hypothetical protein
MIWKKQKNNNSQDRYKMANKYMKKCSVSSAIWNADEKWHWDSVLPPQNGCGQGKTKPNAVKDVGNGTLVKMSISSDTMEVPQKLKLELPYDPAIYHIWAYTQRNVSHHTIEIAAHPCL